MKRSIPIGLALLTLFAWLSLTPAPALDQKPPLPPVDKSAPADRSTPSIQIPETDYHFGEVSEGAVITHSFKVKNTGTGLLEIQQVKPG